MNNAQTIPVSYNVIDNQTGAAVRSGLTLRQAYRAADKLDLKYGAVRYIVRRAV